MKKKPAFNFLCFLSGATFMILKCSHSSNAVELSGKAAPDDMDKTSISISQEIASVKTESLKKLAKEELGLVEMFATVDTLHIVSTSPFLYFPFGKFRDINALSKIYKNFKITVEHDLADSSLTLYRMSGYNSFLKFFSDVENNTLEIVSGKIDDTTSLVNGIKIGIDKRMFLQKFFRDIPIEHIITINVIKLSSGLEGIYHFYTFNKDNLASIYFDTDYSFNKN